jgi:hypothetical protein
MMQMGITSEQLAAMIGSITKLVIGLAPIHGKQSVQVNFARQIAEKYNLKDNLILKTKGGDKMRPKFTAGGSVGPALFAYRAANVGMFAVPGSIEAAERHSLLKAFLVRVFDPEGKPLHGAEVRVRTSNSIVSGNIPKKCRRGATVKGMWQCYVPCSNYNPLNPWPSQINYEVEVWSVWGILRRSFWVGTNSWTCEETQDLEFRFKK